MHLAVNRITKIALISLIIFGGLGLWIMDFARESTAGEFIMGFSSLPVQLIVGLLFGSLAGAISWWLIRRPFMRPVHGKYTRLFQSLKLKTSDIIIISLCAGIGEELLFRGAIQPYLGIYLTAIVFVALHGYLDPRNWRLSIYGILMTGIIIALGYFTEYIGIISAITAHVVIDLVLLFLLLRVSPQNLADQTPHL